MFSKHCLNVLFFCRKNEKPERKNVCVFNQFVFTSPCTVVITVYSSIGQAIFSEFVVKTKKSF